MLNHTVKQSNYKEERKCPVCKKIVKITCLEHKSPQSVIRMIYIKLKIKEKHNSLKAKIDKQRVSGQSFRDAIAEEIQEKKRLLEEQEHLEYVEYKRKLQDFEDYEKESEKQMKDIMPKFLR